MVSYFVCECYLGLIPSLCKMKYSRILVPLFFYWYIGLVAELGLARWQTWLSRVSSFVLQVIFINLKPIKIEPATESRESLVSKVCTVGNKDSRNGTGLIGFEETIASARRSFLVWKLGYVFAQPHLNTRGIWKIRGSYANPGRSRGFA